MASQTLPRRPARGTQVRADRTHAAVIAETIRCIHEEGFAAASARHIAKRAGVTWGVIQYHFGDRDGLLTAVVDHAFGELIDLLEDILPQSAAMTTRRRTQFVIDAVWSVFRSPNSLAAMEIVTTTRSVRDSLATTHLGELHKTFTTLGRHLGEGLATRHAKEIGNLVWTTLRGLIVVQLTVAEPFDASRELRALVEVITTYIESHQPMQPTEAPRAVRTRRVPVG
jgi:TetR/AcrR family transcriptional regulator, regulator of cefoperazone and chloramphenicol sensitivity